MPYIPSTNPYMQGYNNIPNNSPQYSPYQYQMQPQPQHISQQNLILRGNPVGSEDEARRALIELDGSIYIFPDFQHGIIYTKQINTADFTPIFRVYQIREPSSSSNQIETDLSNYVSRSDFNNLAETVQQLQTVVNQMTVSTQKRAAKEPETKC